MNLRFDWQGELLQTFITAGLGWCLHTLPAGRRLPYQTHWRMRNFMPCRPQGALHCVTNPQKKNNRKKIAFAINKRCGQVGNGTGAGCTHLRPGLHTPHALAALVVAFLACRGLFILIACAARAAVLVATVHRASLHRSVAALATRLLAQRPLALGPVRTGLIAAALERVGHIQPLGHALWVLHDIHVHSPVSASCCAARAAGIAGAAVAFSVAIWHRHRLCFLTPAAQRAALWGGAEVQETKLCCICHFSFLGIKNNGIGQAECGRERQRGAGSGQCWLLKYLNLFLILCNLARSELLQQPQEPAQSLDLANYCISVHRLQGVHCALSTAGKIGQIK